MLFSVSNILLIFSSKCFILFLIKFCNLFSFSVLLGVFLWNMMF